ncbi:hypothetical protein GCM10017714_23950 [Curtobacterium pusillum]|uniref:Secreted protein n=1 Tax=Curtobacterium pusillum TaxID=69373 RepID=A0ABX2MBC0_9MICO|nr:hypothetical protein [Curtobacterium pusillum]NUU14964.1 hypothetical protein [Curtobacterium pusillum]GLK32527.1 hypothetical protein GCM10017610_28120 [Curtobacterium pusillum]
MTFRTVLALSAAVFAFSGGTVVVDGVSGVGAAPAAAVEVSPHSEPRDDAARVTNAKLKRVDSIELDAESLVFRRGSKTVVEASMRDSRTTVSLLNRLLGTPSRTQTAEGDGGACFPSGTTYTWGGAVRVAALTTPAPAGNAVEIRVLRDAVQSRFGDDVELTGPDGVQVGDDIHDAIADAPKSERVSFGSDDAKAWQLLLEAGWTPDDDQTSEDASDSGTNGVSALTDDTTVTVLGSPMPVHAQRSC